VNIFDRDLSKLMLFANRRRLFARYLECVLACAFAIALSGMSNAAWGAKLKLDSPAAILHEMKCFRQMGSVLYIAAHPDDENTELLAYLARGRDYRTAYLSLTRGDGGQNVLGPDLGDKLGVARTQELLAARELDGAQQFFSRAIDFGFSKNYLETLKVWDKNEVLSDMVRVIREFRPDVLVTRFSPSPGGTHGHHTTSAVLALEAFKVAGDPKAFPEHGLPPWQPKRIFWNISTFQREKAVGVTALKIDAEGKDPVTGEIFTDVAAKSRAMHKTQGFDTFQFPGAHGGERIESFQLLDGAPATKDIMEDVDTTWKRVPGGEEIQKSIDAIIAGFDRTNIALSVPALLKLKAELAALHSTDLVVKEKRQQLDRILQACLGLRVETTIAKSEVVPGESLKLHHSATLTEDLKSKSGDKNIAVRWLAVKYPKLDKEETKGLDLHPNQPVNWDSVEMVPENTPLTQPYWLKAERSTGMFGVADANLIGTAENAPSFPIENIFSVGGQTLVINDEPVQIIASVTENGARRRLDVIPPVSLRFTSDLVLLTPGTARSVEVEITASRAGSRGDLELEIPSGWKVEPLKQSFNLVTVGQHERLRFTLTAPSEPSSGSVFANAEVDGVRYHNDRQQVLYAHLPPQLLQPIAVLKAVSFDFATTAHSVGYLPGAGDMIAESLQQLGYAVKSLDDANLTAEQLKGLDAVVIGVRAFNVRKKIGIALPILFDYMNDGGTVIVQYNRPDKLQADKIAPYDLRISADRVTDEKATITFLDPENPVLNKPNKITSADFDNWVQERGLYFPNRWDDNFKPIIACNDPGEAPLKGALLVARYGKGHFIYTGLSFFRQLPAGVPGAYRLFANMISIGK
jgi:LmbE family N-acetylglucosaminyl deacetylase